jgi:hypothetical protein
MAGLDTVAQIVAGPFATLITNIIDRLFPDKDAQAAQRAELLLQAQQIDLQLSQAQNAVNQAEAANPSVFVAGWRPFIGWVCGVAFAYKYVIQPFLIFMLIAGGSHFDATKLPVLDWSDMGTVLLGMLGLGTMRSVEKVKGAA